MNEKLELSGTIEQIVFKNEENDYSVVLISPNNDTDYITIVGVMPNINIGEKIHLTGTLDNHPTFGEQIKVENYSKELPSDKESILKFLSCGAIKGIGKSTATKLIEKFGDETLYILENFPDKISKIKGISPQKAEVISAQVKNITCISKIMDFLSPFSVTPEQVTKIYNILGSNAIDKIKLNPYVICSNGINLDFDKADAISLEMGNELDNAFRIKAGILYILEHNINNGHTCLPRDKLREVCAKYLDLESDLVEEQLTAMIDERTIVSCKFDNKEFIFTLMAYSTENYIATRLKTLLEFPAKSITNIDKEIKKIEVESNIKYASLQKEAIKEALSKGLIILTGGPGTGKSTTLNGIIKILEEKGEKVYLAAPTGRAARRMSEITGKEAKTIHRLLEVSWDSLNNTTFNRNEYNPLKCDALVLDELSMIDVFLMENLIKALPLGCRLIMVGDPDQLPSVGAGNVLKDLIRSNSLPVVSLKEIFRQSLKSLIITNAHKIINGEYPELHERNSDFFFIKQNDAEEIKNTILDLYKRRLPNAYGYYKLDDIQVLCQSKLGILGTVNLNKSLREMLNPSSYSKSELKIGNTIFRKYDKIIQIKNDYDITWTRDNGQTGTGVFNGDIGTIIDIDNVKDLIQVKYDDKIAIYDTSKMINLELAYAMTVHKSQGSEFNAIIMPMFDGPKQLYYRNLLYTGVTRAKSIVIMVGKESIVNSMVNNDKKTKRYTGLKFLLSNL